MKHLSPDMLKQYRYFEGLSDGALEEIAGRLEKVELAAGTKIIKEGEPADSFYIVKEGEVEVTKTTKWGQEARITNLKCGAGFGEMALLTCSTRNSSVLAKTDVELYKLMKIDFEEIVLLDSTFTNMLVKKNRDHCQYNKMKTLQPLAILEPGKMLALTEKLIEKHYTAGENIITQGGPGDAYYILKSGRAEVIKKKGGNDPEQVAVLGEGEGFGEEALIREEPRNATVRAIDDTLVLRLEKSDFDEIMKKSFLEWDFPEDIMDERGKYIIIDARIAPEYEEEHIEGALNIPIEVLRQRFTELDPSCEYYTYCTNDSRGMTAAFLMRSQGFRAKSIRGGLGAWDGPVTVGSDGVYFAEQDGTKRV